MAKTKFVTSETLVTANFNNQIFGGLRGTTEGSMLDPTDPLIAGIVHDGANLDGHAAKISLTDHVTDELDGALLQDSSVPNSKLIGPIGTNIEVQDEGVSLGSFNALNIVGSGVTAADAGSDVATITVSGTLAVQEEGLGLGNFTTINFLGSTITAADAGSGVVSVTVDDPPAVSTTLQDAWDNGNTIVIPDASSAPVTITNNDQNAEALTIVHGANNLSSGISVDSTEADGIAGTFENSSQVGANRVVLANGRSAFGSQGGSATGYFVRGWSSITTDQAVVYIRNASGTDDQPSLRVDQSSPADAAEFNGDVTINGKLNVTGLIDPTGLVLTHQATRPSNPITGEAQYWARTDDTPMFTTSGGTDSELLTISGTDNRVIRMDGTGNIQESVVEMNDSGKLSWPSGGELETVGTLTLDAGTDVTIQENGSLWIRFDSSADTMNFTGAGFGGTATIESDGDIDLAPGTGSAFNFNNDEFTVPNNGTIYFDNVTPAFRSSITADLDMNISCDGGDLILFADGSIDLISENSILNRMGAGANDRIRYSADGFGTFAQFGANVSGDYPLILAGTDSLTATPSNNVKFYVEGVGTSMEIQNNSSGGTSALAMMTMDIENVVNPGSNHRYIRFDTQGATAGYISGDGSGGLTYFPFTGGHRGLMELVEPESYTPGMILRTSGSVSNNSPNVMLADSDSDNRVIGVFAKSNVNDENNGFEQGKELVHYHAVGDGFVLVTNKSGNVMNGDLIESSSVAGYGQRQSDNLIKSSTVAKCTQDVDWELVEERVDGFKTARVACVYYCG